ncbi:MAG: hypothetical protein V4686_01935 [Patescibacteria group bacterium]
MKKKLFLTIIFTSIITLGVYSQLFQPQINIGGFVKYETVTNDLTTYPTDVSAFGVLKLNANQPDDINQIFRIELVNDKIILIEGLVSNDRTIVMHSRKKTLDIISSTESQLIAKDDLWTVTISKNSVVMIDKDGKGGNLVSGFAGSRMEYNLSHY